MKTIKKKPKNNYLKYLFWLGPILSIMGLSARVVAGEWSPISSGLLIAGLAIIVLWLILLGSSPGFWGRRSTQAGTNAIIATLAMIVILGLINFLAVRYGQRIDFTENQLFTLSPLSQRVVRTLQQPVKVWVFSPNPNPNDLELLKNYRRYGSKLDYEFVDPQLKPGLAQQLNVKLPGEVHLKYGQKQKLVQTVNETDRLSEIKLTNSIEQLTSDRIDKVYFLQGHGERPLDEIEGGLSQALSALKDKSFTPLPLNLAERSEVPKDASLVVVAGPKRALFEPEVLALNNYLLTGGSLLLMLDPEINAAMDSLLADWGVKLDRQIVIDASGQGRVAGLGPATPLVTTYGNHPITKDFGNNYSLYPVAQPIEVIPKQGVTETPLLRTNEQSWAESTPEKQPLQFDPKSDRPGPLTLAVALSRKAIPSSALPASIPQATASPGKLPSPSPSPTGQGKASPTPTAQATASPGASPSPTGQAKASPTPTPQVTVTPGTSPSPSSSPIGQASPLLANEGQTDKRTSESRLVVIGNSSFSTNGWFEQQLNGDVFLNSVSWLSKRDDQTLSIRPKEQKNRRTNLTSMQAGILGWTGLLIMPLLGLMTAGVMWWRRR
ncbi:GldG family protein [Allocoleopsis sp.]|uniref:GldG family protein n=1 Tax=Allocoleopsis sp. TaxID=3088169 RepID=UPI002FD6B5AF